MSLKKLANKIYGGLVVGSQDQFSTVSDFSSKLYLYGLLSSTLKLKKNTGIIASKGRQADGATVAGVQSVEGSINGNLYEEDAISNFIAAMFAYQKDVDEIEPGVVYKHVLCSDPTRNENICVWKGTDTGYTVNHTVGGEQNNLTQNFISMFPNSLSISRENSPDGAGIGYELSMLGVGAQEIELNGTVQTMGVPKQESVLNSSFKPFNQNNMYLEYQVGENQFSAMTEIDSQSINFGINLNLELQKGGRGNNYIDVMPNTDSSGVTCGFTQFVEDRPDQVIYQIADTQETISLRLTIESDDVIPGSTEKQKIVFNMPRVRISTDNMGSEMSEGNGTADESYSLEILNSELAPYISCEITNTQPDKFIV